jgi:hypothetical protein
MDVSASPPKCLHFHMMRRFNLLERRKLYFFDDYRWHFSCMCVIYVILKLYFTIRILFLHVNLCGNYVPQHVHMSTCSNMHHLHTFNLTPLLRANLSIYVFGTCSTIAQKKN